MNGVQYITIKFVSAGTENIDPNVCWKLWLCCGNIDIFEFMRLQPTVRDVNASLSVYALHRFDSFGIEFLE